MLESPVWVVPFPHSMTYWVAAFGATALQVTTALPPALTEEAETLADWHEVLDTTVVGRQELGSQISPGASPPPFGSSGSQVSSGSTTPSPHQRG